MRYSAILAASVFTGAAVAKDITVAVGTKEGEIVFKPDSITAEEGDNIHFKFWPKNHSIAQSTFAAPCTPMRNGVWSGFVPTTDADKAAADEFHMTVTNASQPIWLYCSQGQHCQNGMVAVVNPPRSGRNTLAAFKEAAKNATDNVSPTSTTPVGGNITKSEASGESSSPSSSSAAMAIQGNTFAVSGIVGMFAYFML